MSTESPASERALPAETELLHRLPFLRLWTAGLVSLGGSTIGQLAISYLVYLQTGSAVLVGILGAASTVPNLIVGVFAGAIADRYNRRRVMVFSDIVRSASWAAVGLTLLVFGFVFPLILGAVALASSVFALFAPAERALLPELVPDSMLGKANGVLQSSNQILAVGAFAVAGFLVALAGADLAVLLNSLTFLVSGVLLASIGKSPRPVIRASPIGSSPEGFWQGVLGGFVYLRSNSALLWLTIEAMFVNFFLNLVIDFLVVFNISLLHQGALVYGVLLGSLSVGFASGALVSLKVDLAHSMGRIWVASCFGTSIPMFLLILFPSPILSPISLAVMGAVAGVGGTAWLTGAQRIVPREIQGRYFAIDSVGSFAIIPLAQILGGFLVQDFGVRVTYLAAAAGELVSAAPFFFVPVLWNLSAPRAQVAPAQ